MMWTLVLMLELSQEIWVQGPAPELQPSPASGSFHSAAAMEHPGRCSGKQSSTELLLVTLTTEVMVTTDPQGQHGVVLLSTIGLLHVLRPITDLARG